MCPQGPGWDWNFSLAYFHSNCNNLHSPFLWLTFNEAMMRPSPYSYKALPHSTFIQQTFAEYPLKARFWAKTNKQKQNTGAHSCGGRGTSTEWNGRGTEGVRKGTVDKQGRGHLNGGGEERNSLGRTHRKVTYEEHLEECLPFAYRTVTKFLGMKARARIYSQIKRVKYVLERNLYFIL